MRRALPLKFRIFFKFNLPTSLIFTRFYFFNRFYPSTSLIASILLSYSVQRLNLFASILLFLNIDYQSTIRLFYSHFYLVFVLSSIASFLQLNYVPIPTHPPSLFQIIDQEEEERERKGGEGSLEARGRAWGGRIIVEEYYDALAKDTSMK